VKINFLELTLRPIHGHFDISAVLAYLKTMPYCSKDSVSEYSDDLLQTFMICGTQITLEYCKKERKENPDNFPLVCSVVLVYPTDNKIGIGFYGDAEDPSYIDAAKFVLHMLGQYKCKISDEFGHDWTEQVEKKGAESLFE